MNAEIKAKKKCREIEREKNYLNCKTSPFKMKIKKFRREKRILMKQA